MLKDKQSQCQLLEKGAEDKKEHTTNSNHIS